MDRRSALGAISAALVARPAAALAPLPGAALLPLPGVGMLAALEQSVGGHLHAYVLDTGSGRAFGWGQDNRVAHCSTFKLSLAALALAEIDAGRARGDEVLAYSALDVLPNSPVTAAASGGLPILVLAQAAVEHSDNLAANLLLTRFGGPARLTAFWRSMGDQVSRLDHPEPQLNRIAPGSIADTTTPAAMAATAVRLLTGPVLNGASRATVWRWMKACQTGAARVRAGLPAGWDAGDKTGTATYADGRYPSWVNDLALVSAPVGDGLLFPAPLMIAAYYQPGHPGDDPSAGDEAVLASVARIATDPAAWGPLHHQRRHR